MANRDTPFGLRAITSQAGTAPQIHRYTAAASTAIYEGGPVAFNASNLLVMWTNTATDRLKFLGVAVNGRAAADTLRTIMVYDGVEQEYECQGDTAFTSTDLLRIRGINVKLVNPSTGNGTHLQSKTEILATSCTTLNTPTTLASMRIVRMSQYPDQDNTAAYAKVIVKINRENHLFSADV